MNQNGRRDPKLNILAACTLNVRCEHSRQPETGHRFNYNDSESRSLMPQNNASSEQFDAVIVGAGAGGGTAVRVLADHGMKLCLIEAGPMLDPTKEFKEHKSYADYPHRGVEDGGKRYFGTGKPYGFMTTTSGGWTLPGEPYTVGDDSQFKWFRSRIVGGRTNHYGRMSFRFSQLDLKARDRDGLGDNWPIDYSELSPYYDKAEKFIGVTGTVEGIASAPDGIFETPPPPQVHAMLARETGKKLDIPFIANRRAVITSNKNGRAACHYCGECGRGCLTASAYSASQVDIFPALETGRVTLITDAMAREVCSANDSVTTTERAPSAPSPCRNVRPSRRSMPRVSRNPTSTRLLLANTGKSSSVRGWSSTSML